MKKILPIFLLIFVLVPVAQAAQIITPEFSGTTRFGIEEITDRYFYLDSENELTVGPLETLFPTVIYDDNIAGSVAVSNTMPEVYSISVTDSPNAYFGANSLSITSSVNPAYFEDVITVPTLFNPTIYALTGTVSDDGLDYKNYTISTWTINTDAEYYEKIFYINPSDGIWRGEFCVPDCYIGLDVWQWDGSAWVIKTGQSEYSLSVPYAYNFTDKVNGSAYAAGIPADWGSGTFVVAAPSPGSLYRAQLRVDAASNLQLKVRIYYATKPAIGLDGVNDYVCIPHSASLYLSSDFSVSVWVALTKTPLGWRGIIDKGRASLSGFWLLGDHNRNNLVYGIGFTDSSYNEMRPPEMTLGQLYFYTFGVEGSNQFYSQNGAQKSSYAFTNTVSVSTQNLTLGCRNTGTAFEDIKLSDVRIYNRALNSTEISTLYGGGNVTDGLKLWFSPSGWNGTHFVDLSGNGNHGTPYSNAHYKVVKTAGFSVTMVGPDEIPDAMSYILFDHDNYNWLFYEYLGIYVKSDGVANTIVQAIDNAGKKAEWNIVINGSEWQLEKLYTDISNGWAETGFNTSQVTAMKIIFIPSVETFTANIDFIGLYRNPDLSNYVQFVNFEGYNLTFYCDRELVGSVTIPTNEYLLYYEIDGVPVELYNWLLTYNSTLGKAILIANSRAMTDLDDFTRFENIQLFYEEQWGSWAFALVLLLPASFYIKTKSAGGTAIMMLFIGAAGIILVPAMRWMAYFIIGTAISLLMYRLLWRSEKEAIAGQ